MFDAVFGIGNLAFVLGEHLDRMNVGIAIHHLPSNGGPGIGKRL